MTFEKSISFHLVAGGGRGKGGVFLLLLWRKVLQAFQPGLQKNSKKIRRGRV